MLISLSVRALRTTLTVDLSRGSVGSSRRLLSHGWMEQTESILRPLPSRRNESAIDFITPQKLPRMMFAWPET